MDVVLKCVNKIRAKALNRREFREFITNLDDEYGELLLHCEVRWLSRGKVLSRFWDLKAAVFLFLSEIDELRDERQCLVNDEWLCDLAFLVDVTSFLNELNISLQGNDKLFTNLCDDVSAFKMKLSLMINQLSKGNFVSFPTVASQSVAAALNLTQYKEKLQLLLEAFQDRFAEFDAEQDHVALFTNPFVFPDAKICQLETNLQNELINLKCNSAIRAKFMELPVTPTCTDYVRFWQLLPLEKFRHLRYFSQRYLCRFGSTYRCEQAFSAMKLIKSKQRSRLTDVNLGALMTLATTNLKPDIEKLASK